MKLVNCPVCGGRCSADIEKCPECGFEIRQYFEKRAVPKNTKKLPILLIAGVLIVVLLAMVLIPYDIFLNKQELAKHAEKAESLEDIFPTAQTTPDDTITLNEPATDIDVSGVYSGDDHEILVLNTDGLAYYYCNEISFTELACPWYIKDDTVNIEFSRMHCIVTSKIDDKELLFRSESANWNAELFTRLDVEPEQYLTKALSTYDPNATLNSDGTLTYQLDGISYTLPKSFIDLNDKSDKQDDWSAFVDNDAQANYVSTVLFYRSLGSFPKESDVNNNVTDFASRFLNKAAIISCTATTVAGYPGYLCEVTGYLNKGFVALQNYEVSGYIAVFNNENTHKNNYVMFVQSSSRSIDNSDVFGDILKSAH
ncbi:MAG: hypothetical protein IJ695_06665 [Butyrivibrio sp.]|nr:hypothetical protein [Butyrivibrio sp.]